MNRLTRAAACIAAISLIAGSALAQGGRRDSDCGDRQDPRQHRDQVDRYGWQDRPQHRDRADRGAYEVAASLESQVDRFARSLDHALDRSRLNGSQREDVLNAHAKRLEHQTDRLKDLLRNDRGRSAHLVSRIFEEARVLDRFMDRRRLDRRAERDWRAVTRDLDRLAQRYRVAQWQGRDDDRGRRLDERDRHGRRG